jgi:F0F1-type ATP synthase membrane subunit a
MSLTVRLYANMFAGGLVTLVFFSLVPLGIPVVFPGTASAGFCDSGVCLHAAGDDLSVSGCLARSLAHDH